MPLREDQEGTSQHTGIFLISPLSFSSSLRSSDFVDLILLLTRQVVWLFNPATCSSWNNPIGFSKRKAAAALQNVNNQLLVISPTHSLRNRFTGGY